MSDEFEVESILKKRTVKGQVMYLVRWLGYNDNEATWENAADLKSCQDLIKDFEKNGKKPAFIPRAIVNAKHDKDEKEVIYTCISKNGEFKDFPSHLLQVHYSQMIINYLQDNSKCEDKGKKKRKTESKQK